MFSFFYSHKKLKHYPENIIFTFVGTTYIEWKYELKAAVRNFFGLKIIQNQYLSKYVTSQCSKLLPYFSPIHNCKLIIMFSNLSGTGRFSREIRAWHCIITSRL